MLLSLAKTGCEKQSKPTAVEKGGCWGGGGGVGGRGQGGRQPPDHFVEQKSFFQANSENMTKSR